MSLKSCFSYIWKKTFLADCFDKYWNQNLILKLEKLFSQLKVILLFLLISNIQRKKLSLLKILQ